jgi:hypothetical protein
MLLPLRRKSVEQAPGINSSTPYMGADVPTYMRFAVVPAYMSSRPGPSHPGIVLASVKAKPLRGACGSLNPGCARRLETIRPG